MNIIYSQKIGALLQVTQEDVEVKDLDLGKVTIKWKMSTGFLVMLLMH